MLHRAKLTMLTGWVFCLITAVITLFNIVRFSGLEPQTRGALERTVIVQSSGGADLSTAPFAYPMSIASSHGDNRFLNRAQPTLPLTVTGLLHRAIQSSSSRPATVAAGLATFISFVLLGWIVKVIADELQLGASAGWAVGALLVALQILQPANDYPPGLLAAIELALIARFRLLPSIYAYESRKQFALCWIGFVVSVVLLPWTIEFGWFISLMIGLSALIGHRPELWRWAVLTSGIVANVIFFAWHDTVTNVWWYRDAVIAGLVRADQSPMVALGIVNHGSLATKLAGILSVSGVMSQLQAIVMAVDVAALIAFGIVGAFAVVAMFVRFEHFEVARARNVVCLMFIVTMAVGAIVLRPEQLVQLLTAQVPVVALFGMGLWSTVLLRRAWAAPHMVAAAGIIGFLFIFALIMRTSAAQTTIPLAGLRDALKQVPTVLPASGTPRLVICSDPPTLAHINGGHVIGLPTTKADWDALNIILPLADAPIVLTAATLERGKDDPWYQLYAGVDHVWQAMEGMSIEDARLLRSGFQVRIPPELDPILKTYRADTVEFRKDCGTVIVLSPPALATR
ncbi:MAG: hypothetical protein ACKO14_13795 [Armatimonadota bacterium]